MRTSGVRAVASSDTRSREKEREMDAWTRPEYVVYATMLIEYGQITRGRQIRRVMKVVIHGIAKECGQCGEKSRV